LEEPNVIFFDCYAVRPADRTRRRPARVERAQGCWQAVKSFVAESQRIRSEKSRYTSSFIATSHVTVAISAICLAMIFHDMYNVAARRKPMNNRLMQLRFQDC
jgi:hypothetical protein